VISAPEEVRADPFGVFFLGPPFTSIYLKIMPYKRPYRHAHKMGDSKAHSVSRLNDGEGDMIPMQEREEFLAAKRKIENFVTKIRSCTVGVIRRKFPEYTHYIQDALRSLKMDNKVDYDEHRPAPTKIRLSVPPTDDTRSISKGNT
jgi:hypothetical protein